MANKTPAPSFASKLRTHHSADEQSGFKDIQDQLSEWIVESYDLWRDDPMDWRIIEFDNAAEADQAEDAGKWAIRTVFGGRYTFTRKRKESGETLPENWLIYRVKDFVAKPRKPKADSEPQIPETTGLVGDPETVDAILGSESEGFTEG